MSYSILIDKEDQETSKEHSRTVKAERKAEKVLILQDPEQHHSTLPLHDLPNQVIKIQCNL